MWLTSPLQDITSSRQLSFLFPLIPSCFYPFWHLLHCGLLEVKHGVFLTLGNSAPRQALAQSCSINACWMDRKWQEEQTGALLNSKSHTEVLSEKDGRNQHLLSIYYVLGCAVDTVSFILTNFHNISLWIRHYYFHFCRENRIWEVTCPGSQVVSKRDQTQHQLCLTSKFMFLISPQNQNGRVSWRHGELNLRLALPASCSGGLGALISSFCVFAQWLSLPCLHTFQDGLWNLGNSSPQKKITCITLCPHSRSLAERFCWPKSEMSLPFQRAKGWRFWWSPGGSGAALGLVGGRKPSRHIYVVYGICSHCARQSAGVFTLALAGSPRARL